MYRQALIWEASSVLRHELRNKLASIRNATSYLQKRVERDAPDLAIADKRVPTFFALIDRELTSADMAMSAQVPGLSGPAVLESLDLEALVDEAVACVRTPDRIALVRAPRSATRAHASRELAVAVLCLFENALDAIADRGTITVTCRRDGDRSAIEILDDGSGMNPELAERAIEPGTTSRPGRPGLGLTIARRMAVRSRGALQLGDAGGGKPGFRATLVVPASAGS